MAYLGNPALVLAAQDNLPVANYQYPQDPTVDVNPRKLPCSWLNTATGEIFVCTDNTAGANVWVSSRPLSGNGVIYLDTDFSTDISSTFTSLSGTWAYNSSHYMEQTSTSGQAFVTLNNISFLNHIKVEASLELGSDDAGLRHFGFYLHDKKDFTSIGGARISTINGSLSSVPYWTDASTEIAEGFYVSQAQTLTYSLNVKYDFVLTIDGDDVTLTVDGDHELKARNFLAAGFKIGFHAYGCNLLIHSLKISDLYGG